MNKTRLTVMLHIVLVIVLSSGLAACGNKGELVRPAPKTAAG